LGIDPLPRRVRATPEFSMSLRAQYPKARLPDTHFFVTFARGDNARCFAIKPGILWSLAALLPLLGAWYLGATLYLIFRDDMLASLMKRQTDMQYAYEDRLAGMRAHLDRVTSRQLLDQGTFEGKVHDLLSRQAKLESRAAVVATLANQVSFGDVTGSTPKPSGVKASAPPITTFMPVTGPAVGGPLPGGALGFAPADAPVFPAKPRPESFELRSWHAPGAVSPTTTETVADAAPPETLPARLGAVSSTLDHIERQQIVAMSLMEKPAATSAARLRQAFADLGLSPERMSAPKAAHAAMGGPFIPLKVDAGGSPFEQAVARLQEALKSAEKLRALVPYVPLRKPLPGADVTSSFGSRVDPFFGRAAMHSGIDFREEYGAPIRATAAGKVISAGQNGGYGNMVEIDHGNGITTRYAHMSAVSVSEGDAVVAGSIVGKLGSTGRSTGPHLHYEVRIDDEAVDPMRFLRAGGKVFARGG
jgi:murein DD-endopeptidase MepM/ murein hydrolase activator NlpD